MRLMGIMLGNRCCWLTTSLLQPEMLKDGAKIGWCSDQPLTHIQPYELEVESEYYLFT
jgi:hypothetical protein